LENALAAGRDPAEIEVEWGESELDGQPAVFLVVRDHGPGPSVEPRKNLFEPFSTIKIQGTGLGVATARRMPSAGSRSWPGITTRSSAIAQMILHAEQAFRHQVPPPSRTAARAGRGR
jgi:K+-sensing histidine kinase KdpD